MQSLEALIAHADAAAARGDLSAAAQGFRAIGEQFPGHKQAMFAAARGLLACGDPAAAARLLDSALAGMPASIPLLNLLAEAYATLKQSEAAAATLERMAGVLEQSILAAPGNAAMWAGLGEVRSRLGQWTLAEAAFRQSAQFAPNDARVRLGLAQAQINLGRSGAAAAALAAVLALEPGHAQARAALAALPPAPEDDPDAVVDEGWAADRKGLYGAARGKYESALRARPGLAFALSRLLMLDSLEGRLGETEQHHRDLVASLDVLDLEAQRWEILAVIAYQTVMRPLPRRLYLPLIDVLGRKLSAAAGPARRTAIRETAGRRLKIGYLSACLRDHPIGHVTAALFGAHDRTRFEVHAFYHREFGPSRYTDAIASTVEHFIPLPFAPAEAASVIAGHDIDVLVYLDGYMTQILLPVVTARPAAIQVFWLGHAGGCDLPAIDYQIADNTVVRPGEESLYRAKVVRLPDSYHCASPHAIGAPMTRAEAGLPAEGFVFCAFNNPEKIDQSIFESWMRILARVEGSVLWLSRSLTGIVADNLRTEALARGIAGDRLVFADRLPDKAKHLARQQLCGLLLDTPTLNASATALDALWSGLPVLTAPGDVYGSRIAASFLRALGLDDMIMASRQAYEDRAVHLATHPEELAEIHARLASARYSHPLFDIKRFCRNLEDCLAGIHRDHPRA